MLKWPRRYIPLCVGPKRPVPRYICAFPSMRTKWRTFKPLCPLVAELDEGERNGVKEEHGAYDAADGPS